MVDRKMGMNARERRQEFLANVGVVSPPNRVVGRGVARQIHERLTAKLGPFDQGRHLDHSGKWRRIGDVGDIKRRQRFFEQQQGAHNPQVFDPAQPRMLGDRKPWTHARRQGRCGGNDHPIEGERLAILERYLELPLRIMIDSTDTRVESNRHAQGFEPQAECVEHAP